MAIPLKSDPRGQFSAIIRAGGAVIAAGAER